MSKKPKVKSWYQQIINQYQPAKPLFFNMTKAFISGGLLCAIAQAGKIALIEYVQLDEQLAAAIIMMLVISLAAILTALGIYDKLGQKLGAGLAVPISGFANSVVAAAMEHNSEGLVLGTACNSFKLAGAVLSLGISSAAIVGIIGLVISKI